MDAEFVLTLASQSWLKWFSCPHCDSYFTTSRDGRCTQCGEQLELVRSQAVGCNNINFSSYKLSSYIPWQKGSSCYYYFDQWNELVNPIKKMDNLSN
jgi:hypothetical protein